ncbi:MAG: glutamate--tRNA ligase [Chthoniobacterales bacterium]|nr:glutamate--tRNA ligase [Chthoniobacterales bacterium]
MDPDSVRVRFAPSPTGFLHIGGARTALFNWLFARHTGGKFVLRIEDTDKARNSEEATAAIYNGLRWLELDWDEGPQKGGDFGPYFQSERDAIYERHLQKLQAGGFIFEDAGALRFRSPREHVVVEDIVCGKIDFDLTNPGTHPDMTIRRPDGSWIFHFVNVVDDIEMKISHVIRGEDHLSNTPKHIELYRALGAKPPKFAHIPLILNTDGSKMSKRDAGASVATYIEEGYAPEAVRNYLCLLGWSPKDNREKIDTAEVVSMFDLQKINRRNAAFDLNKCFWLNGQYIAQMSLERFTQLSLPFLQRANVPVGVELPVEGRDSVEPSHGAPGSTEPRPTEPAAIAEKYLRAVLAIVKEKIKHFSEVPEWTRYFFTEEFPFDSAAVEKVFARPEAHDRLAALRSDFAATENWDAATIESRLKTLAQSFGCKTGEMVHPARVAVSGRTVGPSLYHMLEVLGKDRVLGRFDRALGQIPKAAMA